MNNTQFDIKEWHNTRKMLMTEIIKAGILPLHQLPTNRIVKCFLYGATIKILESPNILNIGDTLLITKHEKYFRHVEHYFAEIKAIQQNRALIYVYEIHKLWDIDIKIVSDARTMHNTRNPHS